MSGFLRHWKSVSEGEQVVTDGIMFIEHSVNFRCMSLGIRANVFFPPSCRFPVALQQFSDSMQMVKKKITPGKLTWPTTKVIVEESKLDYFKVCFHQSHLGLGQLNCLNETGNVIACCNLDFVLF